MTHADTTSSHTGESSTPCGDGDLRVRSGCTVGKARAGAYGVSDLLETSILGANCCDRAYGSLIATSYL